jgi:hypothetical protein
MPDLHDAVLSQIERYLRSNAPASQKLYAVLEHLAMYRSRLVQLTLIREEGQQVLNGPFTGMKLANGSVTGCYMPKLLGCYEAELHPYIKEMAQRGYQAVINIGSAEGYYAIGMARLLPDCTIYTYDIDPNAQTLCAELARHNGVAGQMVIGGQFRGEAFDAFAGRKTLVVCDIEGGEADLLDPVRFPALRRMDVIVELHDSDERKCSEIVPSRFAPTHDVKMVHRSSRDLELPRIFDQLGDLDRLLATWEWRVGPTPWAVMTAREREPAEGPGR